jgi:LacI family transcriptional regulator
MAQDVLRRSPHPSAIFAANNFIAIGALRALREAGLRVPEDISLVTFDDTPTHEPYFTAAAQPAYEMGQRATMLLLDRLAGQADEAVQLSLIHI